MTGPREVRSVTEFQQNINEYVDRLKEKKTPLVLTVDGRYQEILDRLARAETIAAIRTGIEQFERGEGIALDEAEDRLRMKHGFSR